MAAQSRAAFLLHNAKVRGEAVDNSPHTQNFKLPRMPGGPGKHADAYVDASFFRL